MKGLYPRRPHLVVLLHVLCLIALIAAANLLATHAIAQSGDSAQAADALSGSPPAETIWTRKQLLGDIGGARSWLGDHGVSVDLKLSQYYQDVVSGGVDNGGEYGAVMDYIVNVNGEKVGLWKDLFLNIKTQTQFGNYDSFYDRTGSFAFANSQLLYPLPGSTRSAITAWTITQFFNEDVMVYGGKLNTFDLLNIFFPFQKSGTAGFFNTNLYAPALPWFRFIELSEFGGGIQKNGPLGLEYGLIVYDPTNRSTTDSDTYDDLFEDVAGIAYYRHYFDVGDKPAKLTFAVGSSSASYTSLEPTVWDPSGPGVSEPGFETGSESGAYAITGYYEQILWQAGPKAERNILLFTGMTIGSNNPGFAEWSGFGTVEFTGYFPSRPKDRIGVGGFYNNLASGLKDATGLIGDSLQDTSGVEFYYNAELTPWLHITANLQLVNSATRDTNTSVIPGIRTVIDF